MIFALRLAGAGLQSFISDLLKHPLQIFVFDHFLIPRRLKSNGYLNGEFGYYLENSILNHFFDHIRHRTKWRRESHENMYDFFGFINIYLVDKSQGEKVNHRELGIIDGLEFILNFFVNVRYRGIHYLPFFAQRIKQPARR